MKRFFHHFRFAMFAVALLCIALGVAMLLWPHEATKVLCYGFGGVLVLSGVLQVVAYLTGEKASFTRRLLLVSGILSAVLGVWVLFSPSRVMTLTVIVMGIVLLYHGVMDVKYGFDIKDCGGKGWGLAMVFGLATCGVGVMVLVNPFEAASALLVCAGIGFIFDGLTDLFAVFTVAHAKSVYEKLGGPPPVIEIEAAAAEKTPSVTGNTAATPAMEEKAAAATEPEKETQAEADLEQTDSEEAEAEKTAAEQEGIESHD